MKKVNRILSIGFVCAALLALGLKEFFAPVSFGIKKELFQNRSNEPSANELLTESSTTTVRKPNIIVILADDLGYGDLGAYGNITLETPNIDRLAEDGLVMTNFYSSAPICSPSRAGLLTGRYPVRSGIMQAMEASGDTFIRKITRRIAMGLSNISAVDMRGGDNMVVGLPESEITLAEALKVAHYRTAAFGKWHLGDFTEWEQFHPKNHGFDHFVGFNMSNDDWPVAFFKGDRKIIDDIGVEQEAYTQIFTDSAIKFIEESRDQPFFVYLSHKDPHQPFFPSVKYAGKSEGGAYGDAVTEFDGSVGQMVSALRRLDLERETLLIVTSDNGPWFEGSPGNLRGRKGQSYEGGFRVPMIVAWPGKTPAGSTSDMPAMNIDFLPTFLDMAGISLPPDREIDGVSLLPVLSGEKNELVGRPLYFFHDYDVEAVRVDQWKYIESISHYTWPSPLDKQDTFGGRAISSRDYTPPGANRSIPTLGTWPLLYRIDRDSGESYNLASKYPEVVEELSNQLEDWKKTFYENPRGWK